MKKRHLAMLLSKLEGFSEPKPELEQYRTPGNVAAELLWLAHSAGDIVEKVVADLGTGTGVLAIGAKLLGAEKVYAVEVDPKALEVAKRNAERSGVEVEFIQADVSEFSERVDTVVMNPPFGSQKKGADRPFLLKAFEVSNTVYSIHLAKLEVRSFIERFSADNGFTAFRLATVPFEIPAQFFFHRKKLERILVDLYLFRRVPDGKA
ncbi:METTL5 family protein [Thermococcus gammatolerans]|uniref:Methyltransferase-like protein 5 n=1 Tax=Thermococcus gammatolerans (strain DSM 15229 / JCM 11827 / EJ3) TaxID=593117 RepID=C5A471_THEGJ|nr:METTL5 family protein [Thermococcus gammatolerans]ACS33033.1 SAM-dependent rRNA adenine methyltransferase, putative [Thermococcus gammatolerans EJ3]